MEVLSKIPLFPALVRPKRAKTSRSLETVSEPSTESESKKIPDDVSSVDDEITIIDWISAKVCPSKRFCAVRGKYSLPSENGNHP